MAKVVKSAGHLTLTAQNNYSHPERRQRDVSRRHLVKLAAGFTASNGSTFHGMIDF